MRTKQHTPESEGFTSDQTSRLMDSLGKMETDPDGNIYVPDSIRDEETAKRKASLDELESLLGKMKSGPYEYWDCESNDILAAECKEDKGKPIAALPGITSMSNEFRAIAALLNAAPNLIRWARKGLEDTHPALVEALEAAEEMDNLLREEHRIERRRSKHDASGDGSFGIAVAKDELAVEWQKVHSKRCSLLEKRFAALDAARGKEASHEG